MRSRPRSYLVARDRPHAGGDLPRGAGQDGAGHRLRAGRGVLIFAPRRELRRLVRFLLRDAKAAMDRSAVDAAWSNNHEHPALVKSLFGLSWSYLYKKGRFFEEEGTSYRFGGMCFAAMGIWLIYSSGSASSLEAGRVRGGGALRVDAAYFSTIRTSTASIFPSP